MRTEKHLKEMLNAPSNIRYLKDIIKEAVITFRKSKIEDYKKNFFIKCTPLLERYGLSSEKVPRLMEKVCDGTYNLSGIDWIHRINVFLSNYTKNNKKGEKALILLKKGEEIEAKIKEQGKNNLLAQHSYFQQEKRGDLTSLL